MLPRERRKEVRNLENDKIKPFMYFEEAFCEPVTDMLTDAPNKATIYWNEKAYKSCDLDYGSTCPHRRCHYSIFNLKNGESIRITCGRRKDEVE